MDTNEIINQLREENEQLKGDVTKLKTSNLAHSMRSGTICGHARDLGWNIDMNCSELCYLIETARASAMVNHKNAELTAQLVAIQDSVVHGKCANSEPCATFCEAIATRKMFKQMQDERDALALENRKLKMFGAEVDAIMRSQDNVWSRQISALCEKVDFAINQDIKALLAAHDAKVAIKTIEEYHILMMRELFDLIPVRSATSFKDDYIKRFRIRFGGKR